ncbi:hypothetical protein GWO43_26885 [candidate division KSB1 bacterium]|nr:hypothetical protein [candidate division KSB1 bacterium]NIR70184.1 hypothetical protein [candidate division KSB1 bacterium]NIS27571.1 hypothetical protein [candidate division KSB1 bacterium]NIT74423.1 hypothetical protein [candidate division KSB1 bacterium]NIU28288.1 hypothetical protein [candidate division KSB1 bacterium]
MEIPQAISQILDSEVFDSKLRDSIKEWATDDLFANFLTNYAKKVSAKLKTSIDIQDQRDIGLELFVARIFLLSGCQVLYEPSKKGPDLHLQLDNEHYFCEVRRIRENLSDSERGFLHFNPKDFRKIGDIICEKFLNLEIGQPNIIYIRSNRFLIEKSYLHDAVNELYKMATAGDTAFFVKKKFKDEQDFLVRASSCSAIILEDLWARSDDSDAFDCIYQNKRAQHPLSQQMLRVIIEAIGIRFRNYKLGSIKRI